MVLCYIKISRGEKDMRLSGLKTIGGFFLGAILSVPAWGANPALPGTLNYVEGQSSIGTQTLDSKSIGSTELQTGQTLTTKKGKAEILLTPGVFLRLDDNSSAKMISPSLTDTEVGVEKGQAMVEVAEIHRENDIRITEDGATARLLKTGLYDFDAAQDQVRVFEGKAAVNEGDRRITVKGGHEVNVSSNVVAKARKFDKKTYEADDLYRWSSLRSAYLADANADAARIYVNDDWFGAGWYWDPWFGAYTFIPADGIFYSPFGWGFYSPFWGYPAPLAYGGHYYHHFDNDYDYEGLGPHFGHGAYYARRPHYEAHPLGHGYRPSPEMHTSPSFGTFGGGFHGVGGFHGSRARRG